jgi:hypothetical protein
MPGQRWLTRQIPDIFPILASDTPGSVLAPTSNRGGGSKVEKEMSSRFKIVESWTDYVSCSNWSTPECVTVRNTETGHTETASGRDRAEAYENAIEKQFEHLNDE